MSFTDNPDWMSGVYTPQQLVGGFTGVDATETVTVPPNTETLMLIAPTNTTITLSSVVGVESGETYPALGYTPFVVHGESVIYVVPVAPALDTQYTVTWSASPGAWYAIADAAVRTILDPNLALALQVSGVAWNARGLVAMGIDVNTPLAIRVDGSGRIEQAGPNASAEVAASTGTLLAAPTAGTINKLYGADLLIGATDSCFVEIKANGTNIGYLAANATNIGDDHVDLQGFEATTAVTITVSGTGSLVCVRYRNIPS